MLQRGPVYCRIDRNVGLTRVGGDTQVSRIICSRSKVWKRDHHGYGFFVEAEPRESLTIDSARHPGDEVSDVVNMESKGRGRADPEYQWNIDMVGRTIEDPSLQRQRGPTQVYHKQPGIEQPEVLINTSAGGQERERHGGAIGGEPA